MPKTTEFTSDNVINAEGVKVKETEQTVEEKLNGLIIVKQIPIIQQQLADFKSELDAKVTHVLSLKVTDSNIKEMKNELASIRKIKTSLENKRKLVKNEILNPYNEFEKFYNEFAKNPLDEAINSLSKQIKSNEDLRKSEKEGEVKTYFYEYCQNLGIDFVKFEDVGINVTLSVSVKKLKEQVVNFLDKVMDDLKLISVQADKAEILAEYKKTLNVSLAITTVSERKAAIAAEQERLAAEQAEREKMENSIQHTGEVFQADIPQEISPIEELDVIPEPSSEAPAQNEEPVLPLTFTVYGTKAQLKGCVKNIREFLDNLVNEGDLCKYE